METEKVLKELDDIREMVAVSARIAAKVEPLLPEGWKATFVVAWPGLNFSSGFGDKLESGQAMEDFKHVCSLVNQATGLKLEREPW